MTQTIDPLQWFKRSCGKWRSERRYFFKEDGDPVCYTTFMEIAPGEAKTDFVIKWTGKTEGQMEVSVNGNTLTRSRDYFGENAHDSQITLIDLDTICFTTTYGGLTYREEIRLLHQDQYRLRQTFATKEDGSFGIAGQYIEFRQSES